MKIFYFVYFNKAGAAVHIAEFTKTFKILDPFFKIFFIGKKNKDSNPKQDYWTRRYPRLLSKFCHEPKELLLSTRNFWEELRILNKERPQIILARSGVYTSSIVLIAKLKKIPIILEVNSPEAFEIQKYDKEHFRLHFLHKFIEKTTIRLSNAVIVVSDNLRNFIVEQYKINPKKMYVNPNGVDPEKFNPTVNVKEIVSEFNLEDKMTVGFIGSFLPWHGVMDLVQVIYELLQEDIDVQLLLVGDGPIKKEVREFIKLKHLEKYIFLTDYVPHKEISQYIIAMDITVMPASNFYGSPIKIFEYMAMEKPVIAPDNGPLREIITQGKDGLLIKKGKSHLKKALLYLIKNKIAREQMGINARKTILDKYTWKKNAERVLGVCSMVYQEYYKEDKS